MLPQNKDLSKSVRLKPHPMPRRIFKIAARLSIVMLALTLLLFVAGYWINPYDQRLSLGDSFHISIEKHGWDARLVFFSDPYGPYSGSIIGLADEDGNTFPPLERDFGFGDHAGVYFRYFRWPGATLWTLRLSLWHPIALFSILIVLDRIQCHFASTSPSRSGCAGLSPPPSPP